MPTNINPYKYCDHVSMDGKPLEAGYVLAPVLIEDEYKLPANMRERLTTHRYHGFRFRIGFMPQRIEYFETHMEKFWAEIRDFTDNNTPGRCVIGHKPNGDPILCPKARICRDCGEKGTHERYNPRKAINEAVSLNLLREESGHDSVDENAVDPEAYVIAKEAPTDDQRRKDLLAHYEKENPRFATIIKICLEYRDKGKEPPMDVIFAGINLKQSRGYQVYDEAYNDVCDLLGLGCYKIKKKQ